MDFHGCDGHIIKKLVACCYDNTKASGGKDGQIELTSSGKCDVNELSWPLNGYVTGNGWNDIMLPLNKATRTGGNIDYTNVNFIRIYSLDDSRECIIDHIRLSKNY